jgi:hypothetical protein
VNENYIDTIQSSKKIIEIDTIKVISKENGGCTWSVKKYEEAIKNAKNYVFEIEKFLSSKLTKDQKNNMFFEVTSSLNNQHKKLSINLSFIYFDTTSFDEYDFNIDSFHKISKEIAKEMLETINKITNNKEIDINTLIIEEHTEKSSEILDGVVKVQNGMSKYICNMIKNGGVSTSLNCKIDDEEFIINSYHSRQLTIKSKEIEKISGFIYAVNDENNQASIKIKKSKKHFTFDQKLRNLLLDAQKNITKMKLYIEVNYEFEYGKKIMKGGHIINSEENKNKLEETIMFDFNQLHQQL